MKKEQRYISVPQRWGKDGYILAIPCGSDGTPMYFGITKARAIIKYIKDIEQYVEDLEDERRQHGRRIVEKEHSG